jgi:indole-3-acetate monooxygenase
MLERTLAATSRLAAIAEPFKVQMDHDRKLPQQVVDLMRQAGLLAFWLPIEYGGPNLGVLDSIRVIEALAQADGTIGWCACTAAINNRIGCLLSSDAANAIFDKGRTSVAGALMPTLSPGDGGMRAELTIASGCSERVPSSKMVSQR